MKTLEAKSPFPVHKTVTPEQEQFRHTPPGDGPSMSSARVPRWRPGSLTIAIVGIAFGSLALGIYPITSQWLNSYNQSQIIDDYTTHISELDPSAEEQLALARKYNDALSAGVVVSANSNVAQGDGHLTAEVSDYWQLLDGNEAGLMGRIRVPSINVDLPIYHGTSENTLLQGAGHLEGSHLPIGGDSTHSVITAHRGLATSRMFTDLDRVEVGDTFTIETLGLVLSYEVTSTKVVAPEDTDTIRPVIGKDQVTLVTCTPLGINTHRILVTGERITPTPVKDLTSAGESPDVPGFPWWIVWAVGGTGVITGYLFYSGRADTRTRQRKRQFDADTATTSGHWKPKHAT